MLTLLVKIFSALNSDNSPRQISIAIALGVIVGLSPLLSFHNLLILFIVLLIRVHLGSFILSVGIFSGIGYLFSFAMVDVGEALLTNGALAPLFNALYQMDWFKLAHWHHTLTFGGMVVGVLLALPVYFISNVLILKYRTHIRGAIERFKIVKALKASNFYRLYSSVSGQG